MVYVEGQNGMMDEIWAAAGSKIFIIGARNFTVRKVLDVAENEADRNRTITCMVTSHGMVWMAFDKKPKLFVWEAGLRQKGESIDLESNVTKQLASCDSIIRQHKKSCLRITCLLVTANYLWAGTSAGVIINLELNNGKAVYHNGAPLVQALSYGHTGLVRFLASQEIIERRGSAIDKRRMSAQNTRRVVLVTGGDGFENFSSQPNQSNETIGKDDATTQLLLWRLR